MAQAQSFAARLGHMGTLAVPAGIVSGQTPLHDEAGEAAKDVRRFGGAIIGLFEAPRHSTSWLHDLSKFTYEFSG